MSSARSDEPRRRVFMYEVVVQCDATILVHDVDALVRASLGATAKRGRAAVAGTGAGQEGKEEAQGQAAQDAACSGRHERTSNDQLVVRACISGCHQEYPGHTHYTDHTRGHWRRLGHCCDSSQYPAQEGTSRCNRSRLLCLSCHLTGSCVCRVIRHPRSA